MPIEEVNRGLIGNDPSADTIREAFRKVNNNFELVNDNIDIKLMLTISTGATVSEIKNQVNALPQFTVTEKQSLWLVCTAYEENLVTVYRQDLYKIFNKGAGTYGVNGAITLATADLQLVDQYINVPPPTINQDNITIRKRLTVTDTSTTAIVAAINALNTFTVSEIQSVIFVCVTRRSLFRPASTYKYKLLNHGKGNYGREGTQIGILDVELIYVNVPVVGDVTTPSTVTYDFGDLVNQSVVEWVNTHSEALTIQSQEDGYVIFKGTINEEEVSYLWVGEPGNYGTGALQSTDADFQLLNETAPEVDQDNIDIRKRFTVVNGNSSTILSAINNLSPYTISETQSVWFVALVRGGGFGSIISATYKYKMLHYGKGRYGQGAIQLSLNDIELLYQNEPVVADVEDDPRTDTIGYGILTGQSISSWLNNHATVTIQPQNEGYTLFNGTINGVEQSYLWIGEPGNYGTGVLQSSDADFQLLSESTPEPNFITYTGSEGDKRLSGIIKVDNVGDRRGFGGSVTDYVPEAFGLVDFNTLSGMGNNYPEMSVYNIIRDLFIGIRILPTGIEINDSLKAGLYGTDDFTEKALQNPFAYLQVKGIIQLINEAIAGGGGGGTLQDLAAVLTHGNTAPGGFTIGEDGVITYVAPNEVTTSVPDSRYTKQTHEGVEFKNTTSQYKVLLTANNQTADHRALVQDKSGTVAYLDDIATAIDTALGSAYRAAGDFDASSGIFPTSGTGAAGGIRRGDVFNVSVAGTIAGETYDVGDTFYANSPNPGQVATNWKRFEVNTSQATASYRGTMRLFAALGASTSGTIDQNTLTQLFASVDTNKVSKTGDTMTGNLKVPTPLVGADAANKSYVDGRVISFNSETKDYTDRMSAAGNIIDYQAALAFDDFVTAGKRAGWFSKIKFFAPIYGYNLAGALVKFVVDSTGVSQMTGVSMDETNYNILEGINVTGATDSRYLNTNFIPNNNGLTSANIAWGFAVPDYSPTATNNASFLISDNPATGDPYIKASFDTEGFNSKLSRISVGGRRQRFMSNSSASEFSAFLNGDNQVNKFSLTQANVPLNTEVTIFRSTRSGAVRRVTSGKVSYLIFTEGLNDTLAGNINKELYRLYQRLGRIKTVGSVIGFFGDSNTAGQGITNAGDRFSVLTSAALGGNELNLGIASSKLRLDITSAAGVRGGYQRYKSATLLDINTMVIMYGTNDMNGDDATTTGDTTILLDYRTKLEEIIQGFKDKGIRVIVLSVPYSNAAASAKQAAWVASGALASKNKTVPFVDVNTLFSDTGTPLTFMTSDGVHFLTSGHKMLADKITSAMNGVLYRQPLIDFPAIAAGDKAFIDVYIPNITKNNAVSPVNFPDLSDAGLMISAEIYADDTVRLRAYNPTNAEINPAPFRGMIKVIIN